MFVFQHSVSAPIQPNDYVVRIQEQDVLLGQRKEGLVLPRLRELGGITDSTYRIFLGSWNQSSCWAEAASDAPPLQGEPLWEWRNLRGVLSLLSPDLFQAIATAKHLLSWHQGQQFCSTCGYPLQDSTTERARVCTHCHRIHYPIIAPAVIVAVRRDSQILLAHGSKFTSGLHSVVAGFVEAGETLEQTVAREVREEVGLEIRDIHYVESQPWPFPNSLMMGFTAEYAQGSIQVDQQEIDHADWYSADNLPELPRPGSIARRLIYQTLGISYKETR
ncbi:MAG TPA: NAD(+) diphosphatase [Fibrobacteraceae bacterium]|nr:NAD(+) diphosphatase [Fibrobacteraceae bacterium]